MQLKQKHPVSANRTKRSNALDFIRGNKIFTVAFLGAFSQTLTEATWIIHEHMSAK